jgi:FkbM family methyltransferase
MTGAYSDLRWLRGKASDLLRLERELLAASELTPRERAKLFVGRFASMLRDTGQLEYLGQTFRCDNRLMPALLPSYLAEIRRLDGIVGLSHAHVLDIGANVGQFGATLSRRFPAAHVWSFEPNGTILEMLRSNAAGSPNWQVVPWGVSEEDGEESLWWVEGKSAQGSIYRDNAFIGLRTTDTVEHRVELKRLTAERLDELGIPRFVELVKIDVEGAEDAVLRGLVDVRWHFLAIETSWGRQGGLSVDGACDLIESLWGERPRVVWANTPGPRDKTLDAVLELTGADAAAP